MRQERLAARRALGEVADGVFRLQLPMRATGIGHVNVYLLPDRSGISVVDGGPGGRRTSRRIREALDGFGPVRDVVITHSHPDHFGSVGSLAGAGTRVHAHRSFSRWWSDAEEPGAWHRGRFPWEDAGRLTAVHGLRSAAFRTYVRRFSVPPVGNPVDDGDEIEMAGRSWRVLHTPGHTVDHVCLYDPSARVLITGDHVLPTLTPHVAGLANGSDPVGRYLESLALVERLGRGVQGLPGHGEPIRDVALRARVIRAHHRARVEGLIWAGRRLGPATVRDLAAAALGGRRPGFLAVSETYAHLEYLYSAGAAERMDGDGPPRYRMVGDPPVVA